MNCLKNDSTLTVEPSASQTNIIIANNKLKDNIATQTISTSYTSKRWDNSEEETLLNALEAGNILSEIMILLPNRSKVAISKRARYLGYSSNNTNGNMFFVKGIKRRNCSSSIKAKSSHTEVKVDIDLKTLCRKLLDLKIEDLKYLSKYLKVIMEVH